MDAAGGEIFLLQPLGNRRWEFKKYTKKKYKQKMEEIRKLPRYRSSLKKKTHKKCYRTSFKIKSKKYTIDQANYSTIDQEKKTNKLGVVRTYLL